VSPRKDSKPAKVRAAADALQSYFASMPASRVAAG
jgi:hypothetical protein